ncbi:hypothetical protein [Brevibacillus laterosporus]|uniref:hypothetical protein n=1 Tax=Brevibacillus laterosporus TaxID=1465 RepID=UPI003D25682C
MTSIQNGGRQGMNGIIEYNQVIEGSNQPIEIDSKIYEGFYISYNNYDIYIYGCATTALVLGQMQKFYILNGDHRKQYVEIIEQGFDKCLSYFNDNVNNINKYSDKLQ